MSNVFAVTGTNGVGKTSAFNHLWGRGAPLEIFDCDLESRPYESDQHAKNTQWHLEQVRKNIDSAALAAKLGRSAVVFGLITADDLLSCGYDLNSESLKIVILDANADVIKERIIGSGKAGPEHKALVAFMTRRQQWLVERFRQRCAVWRIDTSEKPTAEIAEIILQWVEAINKTKSAPHLRFYNDQELGGEQGALSELVNVAGALYEARYPSSAMQEHGASLSDVAKAVASVEPYQPLYRAPEIKQKPVQRICWDRAWAIENHLDQGFKGRRVLDIGCALGFFSLYAADRGAEVTGYDIELANVQICRALAAKSKLPAIFHQDSVQTDTILSLMPLEYDTCFFLSVAHHMCNSKGLGYTQDFIRSLTTRIRSCFIELAVAEEEVKFPWRAALPSNPMRFFDKCSGVRVEKIGYFLVHISKVPRPLFHVTWD